MCGSRSQKGQNVRNSEADKSGQMGQVRTVVRICPPRKKSKEGRTNGHKGIPVSICPSALIPFRCVRGQCSLTLKAN